jgi:FkbM family methyltransferase
MKRWSLANPLLAVIAAVVLLTVALASGYVGLKLGARYQINDECCRLPLSRSLILSVKEKLGLVRFYSELGQDKWASESVFPGVKDGFFVDVGSADGTIWSNTKALEEKGWHGICIDPFPKNMQDRTCQIFKEVVFSQPGKQVKLWAPQHSFWSGLPDTLDPASKAVMEQEPEPRFVEFTTVTLGDILERAKAPRFINFMSMDIEGAEFEALKGFPFDKYKLGALAVEHGFREPKRSDIKALMESHGYKRLYSLVQDDFYVSPENFRTVWQSNW